MTKANTKILIVALRQNRRDTGCVPAEKPQTHYSMQNTISPIASLSLPSISPVFPKFNFKPIVCVVTGAGRPGITRQEALNAAAARLGGSTLQESLGSTHAANLTRRRGPNRQQKHWETERYGTGTGGVTKRNDNDTGKLGPLGEQAEPFDTQGERGNGGDTADVFNGFLLEETLLGSEGGDLVR